MTRPRASTPAGPRSAVTRDAAARSFFGEASMPAATVLRMGREDPGWDCDLEVFRERSGRFLFALPNAGGPLVYLEQGTARQQREHARSELRCPEPDCPSPGITTVSRSARGRRDGYRHLRLPDHAGHSPESIAHRQGKALVAAWAHAHPQVADVRVEAPIANRVADVLIGTTTGTRYAVEVQYAALDVATWRARNTDYLAAGVQPVWLWGHHGPNAPRGRLKDVHREVLERRRPLLWLNPAEEVLAWALSGSPYLIESDATRYQVAFGKLNDLELHSEGLFPPGFVDAREATATERRRREEVARKQREQLAELRRQAREMQARREAASPPSPGQRTTAAAPPAPTHRCRRCGSILDEILVPFGVHLGEECRW